MSYSDFVKCHTILKALEECQMTLIHNKRHFREVDSVRTHTYEKKSFSTPMSYLNYLKSFQETLLKYSSKKKKKSRTHLINFEK